MNSNVWWRGLLVLLFLYYKERLFVIPNVVRNLIREQSDASLRQAQGKLAQQDKHFVSASYFWTHNEFFIYHFLIKKKRTINHIIKSQKTIIIVSILSLLTNLCLLNLRIIIIDAGTHKLKIKGRSRMGMDYLFVCKVGYYRDSLCYWLHSDKLIM